MCVDKRYIEFFSVSKVHKLKHSFMAMTNVFKVIVQSYGYEFTLAMRNKFA